jgi:hypothetical protein
MTFNNTRMQESAAGQIFTFKVSFSSQVVP